MRVAVAGGTTVVGQEIISRLVADGHDVVAFDLENPGNAAQWIQVDFSKPETVLPAAGQVEGAFDAFVSAVDWPPLEGYAQEILVIRFLSVRRLLEAMIGRLSPGASILTVSSRTGWRWREHYDQVQELMKLSSAAEVRDFIKLNSIDDLRAYALASEGLIAWTTLKTEELIGRGIRANTISPAAVQNEFFDDFTKRLGPKAPENLSRAGRVGQPSEVADAVQWMISEGSSWIKGQDLIVDGGIGAMITSDKLQDPDRSNKNQSVVDIATSPSVLKRSARVALVVGIVLAALNHGDRIAAGDVDAITLFKICLTFCVPFCVSTYSSVLAVRSNMQRIQPPI